MQYQTLRDLQWEAFGDAGCSKAVIPTTAPGLHAAFYVVPRRCALPRSIGEGYDYVHVLNGAIDAGGHTLRKNDCAMFMAGESYVCLATETTTLLVISGGQAPAPHGSGDAGPSNQALNPDRARPR